MSRSSHGVNKGCEVTVKVTTLLSFILGATEISNGPELAPDGIVKTIDVLLHELIVIGVLFIST